MKKRKLTSAPPEHLRDEFLGFMDGFCALFDDLPDGAWGAACQEGVRAFNKDKDTNIDEHDGWIFWVSKGAA